MNDIDKDLKSLVGDGNFKKNENLKNYLTFRVDTIAKTFLKVYNKKTLKKVLDYLTSNGKKYVCIGGGSNILFKNKIVKDVVIFLGQGYCKIYNYKGRSFLSAFSGCKVSKVIQKCKNNCFSCLEWAIGIPATLGGAIIMNMGVEDSQISDYIYSVTFYKDGKIKTIKGNKFFSYRNSWFKLQKCVIISCVLFLKKVDKNILQKNIKAQLDTKRLKQPLDKYTCGSTFKNGLTYKSAKLIDEVGLKGLQVGDAVISKKHSNFIVNNGNATGRDIIKLISIIKKVIYKKYKIILEEELVIY